MSPKTCLAEAKVDCDVSRVTGHSQRPKHIRLYKVGEDSLLPRSFVYVHCFFSLSSLLLLLVARVYPRCTYTLALEGFSAGKNRRDS